ncbi:hypothetical protein RFI_12661, partial [Reticulomyxa filosa]
FFFFFFVFNAEHMVKRTKEMKLPTPQVTERELEDVAKLSSKPATFANQGNEATRFLVSDDNKIDRQGTGNTGLMSMMRTPLNSGIRTPGSELFGGGAGGAGGANNAGKGDANGAAISLRTPGQRGDHIMEQARNALLMQTADTPLLGGENKQLDDMDWSGITPKPANVRTPNPLATPLSFVIFFFLKN